MTDKKDDAWVPRHVATEGFNDGRDCSDLFASGITGQDYIDWLRERMRPGPEMIHIEPKTKSKPKPNPTPNVQPEVAPGPTDNVVALRQPEAEPDLDTPPEYSEDALAELFSTRYHESMKYCGPNKCWFVWDGGKWIQDNSGIAIDKSRRICKVASSDVMGRTDLGNKQHRISHNIASYRMFGAVEKIARTDRRHVVKPTRFDSKLWLLNTPGGVVDLKTGQLRPARKDDFCTLSTTAAPGGECPRWLQFLEDATLGDAELLRYLQRVAGYCLTGSVNEHAFFFCYGGGGNGKGTFINMIDWLMGSYSKVSGMDTFTEQRFSKHETELAYLQGARLVTAQETDSGSRWNESRIKQLTGGDPITARKMYGDPFTFYPTFKLLFSGNNKPMIKNVDAAIRRRMYLIPFDNDIPEERQDQKLGAHLREKEAGGILQWAIEGSLDWQHNSLNPPDRVRLTTDEYFEEEDRIGSFFAECCEIGIGHRELTSRLYQRYREWCEENGIFAQSRWNFVAAVAQKGYRSKNRGGQMSIEGLKLPDAYQPGSFNKF
jgi:putative DNA primase/helicase